MRKTLFAVLLCLFMPDARASFSAIYGGSDAPPPDETVVEVPISGAEMVCVANASGGASSYCFEGSSCEDDDPMPAPDPATGERSADEHDDGEED